MCSYSVAHNLNSTYVHISLLMSIIVYIYVCPRFYKFLGPELKEVTGDSQGLSARKIMFFECRRHRPALEGGRGLENGLPQREECL